MRRARIKTKRGVMQRRAERSRLCDMCLGWRASAAKRILILLACFFFSFGVQAQTYPAGTTGYLYEDCKAALKNSARFEDLHRSYCGAFAEGYAAGLMAAHGLELQNTPERDACWDEREAHYARINARLCPHLPNFDAYTADPAYIFKNIAEIAERWVGFLHADTKRKTPLKESVGPALNDMLQPGAFCDALGAGQTGIMTPPEIHPALLDAGVSAFLSFRTSLAAQDKRAQCQADLTHAKGDEKVFQTTRCGAEISGFLIGIQGTAHLQENRQPASVQCEKEIARLYKVLDVAQTMCVKPQTRAIDVAEIYVANFEKLKTAPGMMPFLSWGNDLNNIGYDVIYRGFLCLNTRRKG